MESELPPPQPFVTEEPKKPKKRLSKTPFIVLLALLFVAGIGYGGYWYGQQSSQVQAPASQPEEISRQDDVFIEETFHKVVSSRTPFGVESVITTELAVPNRLQAVVYDSDVQNPGYANILASMFNDEMGRWLFGNPTLTDTYAQAGELSIIHIGNEWLRESADDQDDAPEAAIQGYDFSTPAKKAASLETLKADAEACAKDSRKGFSISNVLNVCYTPQHERQAVGVYAPVLNFKGHATIDRRQYVLFGYLFLVDDTEYTDAERTQMGDTFAEGTMPEATQKLLREYVNALKQTTFRSSEASR